MGSTTSDPSDWTVDEVVQFLCHDPSTPWSSSRPPRPDPASLEASLRENFITGEVLLQDVDMQTLRDDLGLKALGHRSCIMMAIRYLKIRSPKFQQNVAVHTSRLEQTPTLTSPFPMLMPSGLQNTTPRPSPIQRPGASDREAPLENPEPEHIRQQEQTVIDSRGRKRRRLDLSSSIDTWSDKPALEKPDKLQTKDWWMGPDVLSPVQIFYSPETEPDDDDQTFTLIASKRPAAQRSFVNNCLRHFFKQLPVKLASNRWAIVPYRPSMVKSRNDRIFTLYTTKQGAVHVTRERIEEWPQLKHQQEVDASESSKPADLFSYLLQKYPADENLDDAYPVYGDSGSEGEFDNETWKEIDQERSEPTLSLAQSTKLGSLKVDTIIKECLSEYEGNWRLTRLPQEQFKARKLWMAARRGNRANQEIKAITKDITLLEARLRKFQDAVREIEYATEAELRIQCQSLEHTIFNIQKQKWRVSVLERDKCPPRAPPPPKLQSRRTSKHGDEESLDSESDAISNGSLNSFIDDTPTHETQTFSSFSSSSSSDGDDDIISVSGTRRRTRGRAPNVFASTPSPPRPIQEKLDIIDLTMESPEADEINIETPPINPVDPIISNLPGRSASMSPPLNLGSTENHFHVKADNLAPSLPEVDDFDEILLLDWELLEKRQDRSRLLAKLIGGLPDEEREKLRRKIRKYGPELLNRLTLKALRLLDKGLGNIPNMTAYESQLIMRTASLYISWVNCVHLVRGIHKKYLAEALQDNNFIDFYDELSARLKCYRDWKRRIKAEAPGSMHGSEQGNTPHKKRKREVIESQEAKINQASARLRVEIQEEQRTRLEKRLESMGLSNDNPSHQAISFKDPVIYLDPHIGRRVKPHQLNGIRFMWRELIEDKNQQGCLLAHTMGLGKTMQVISLLTTISAAAASNDSKIREQVPKALRRSQTLILCPSSLIENWHDEILMWSPPNSHLGPVRRVFSSNGVALNARLEDISNWYREGGVLLISYDIFRAWVINKETPKRAPPLSVADHEKVKKWLLEGPNIIIADEAHKMKNPTSGISAAALQFRSKSRIALTGSPLANNLADYYMMVNWIAEDYLGKKFVEFKAHYIEPIEEGLYANSTYAERRKSLMRLQVLKQILEPKVNRADITVLEGSLPPKVEFVITVPLSELQKAAYDSYVEFVLEGRTEEVRQAQLWSWLAILALCCHHPSCFRDKLISRANDASTSRKMDEIEQDLPGDEPITQVGLPDLAKLVSKQVQLFAKVPNLKAVELSARATILNRIIEESVKVGDKVLIFSQSIPTLNYIEDVLEASNRQYSRLDGQTPIHSRQTATKDFNQGEKEIYLISTRAGGLGLNIPGANRVIIFDFSFSPVWEEQAVGRAYRLGQQKPVFVYRFLAGGTFEEIIHHKAIFKTQLAVRVVDKKNPVRFAQKKPGDYLFPVKPVPQENLNEFIGKDPLVLDKILLEDEKKEERLVRSIILTQTFHKEDNDKLTEEEKQSVQEQFDDEHLRRTDPAAYEKRLYDRQTKLMQQQHSYTSTGPFPISVVQQNHQPPIPLSAHNVGPPALEPDMSMYRPLNPSPNMRAMPPFIAYAQATQACVSVSTGSELVQRQVQPRSTPKNPPSDMVGHVSGNQNHPNHPPNAVSTQQTAPVRSQPASLETGIRGVGTPRAEPSNEGLISIRGQPEQSQPRAPGVQTLGTETVGKRQGTPVRGKTLPLRPEISASEVARYASETSNMVEK